MVKDAVLEVPTVEGLAAKMKVPADALKRTLARYNGLVKGGRDLDFGKRADRLTAVKWRNWKMHFIRQDTMIDPPVPNPVPATYNLLIDPREEKPGRYLDNSWVMYPVSKILGEFRTSLKQHPPIPMGTPDPYVPPPAMAR